MGHWIQNGSTQSTKKNLTQSTQKAADGAALRAGAGLLAFLLGILLLIESLLSLWGSLSTPNGRRWAKDSFQTDYQNTSTFRQEISSDLMVLLAMGTGQPLDFYGYGGGSPQQQAQMVHKYWEPDQNLLYTVSKSGKVSYTNRAELTHQTTVDTLPEEYNFLLQFDGSQVRIWKDGRELDIYGDGYYDYENWEQWYLPGYLNFKADPSQSEIHITMAARKEPKVFIRTNYDRQYYRLYDLQRDLTLRRTWLYTQLFLLAAGVALLVVSRLLHKDKVRANRAMAHMTGKLWFEGKLLLLLFPLVMLYLQCTLSTPASVSFLPGTGSTSSSSAAPYGSASVEVQEELVVMDGGTVLYHDIDPLYHAPSKVLPQIPDHPETCMLPFLLWYVFGWNDWLYQKKPWRHGICGMLAARQLKRPIQKRMSRMAGLLTGAGGILLMELGYLYLVILSNLSVPLWWHGLILLPTGAALALFLWAILRQNQIWTDLGLLSSQIEAVRAGDLSHPVSLPDHHDLHQTMEDVNHIQQGIHQAVEERTQSERMKVELITNVSHDLKTPLTSIISYTELLEQEQLAPPAGEYVAILGQKAQRLKAMVQDVFEVSKAASGQLPVKLERLDLVRLLRQTLADQDEAIQASGLHFRLSLPEQPVYILADSDRMYRVFQNLLVNALRYALAGSRVYLTVEQRDGRVDTILQNTSATELSPHTDYLGRFVRGDESRTDGGSGLGLSIAASFAQVCGGTLSITTQADLFTAEVSFPVDL